MFFRRPRPHSFTAAAIEPGETETTEHEVIPPVMPETKNWESLVPGEISVPEVSG